MAKKIKIEKVAILTSAESWYVSYAKEATKMLRKRGYNARLFFDHKKIDEKWPTVFILSYFKVLSRGFIEKHSHNLVVHESALPNYRGWAPLFWQILEEKNRLPVVLLEAGVRVDGGDIYIKDHIVLNGDELHDEIRRKQALKTFDLCSRYLKDRAKLKPVKQKGKGTCCRRRTPEDSELDIDKTIEEQFNILRIANNEEYPAFFKIKGHKYILKVYKADENKE